MNDQTRFALIQLDREDHDHMALAKTLAGIRQTPVQDQVLQAKRAFGIIEDGLSKEEAQALGQALLSEGVKVAVGPMAALVGPAEPQPVTSIDELPAGSPTLISAAALTVVTTRTTTETKGPSPAQKAAGAAIMMATGLPIKIGGKKRKVEKTETEQSLSFLAELHYDDPPRRFQIDPSHFDFSCLKGRMTYHGQSNLKLLLGDLVEAHPDAWQNHGAQILLEGQPVRLMGYTTHEDLDREARWLLTLRKRGL